MSGDMETLVERLLTGGDDEFPSGWQARLDWLRANWAIRTEAVSAIQALIARVTELERAIATPEAVIVNMKRGGIALPSPRYLIDCHGDEALAKWDRAEASEARAKELEKVLEPFSEAGRLIMDGFGPTLFPDEAIAFGCTWTVNGEERKLTWGDFRRAALRNVKETEHT